MVQTELIVIAKESIAPAWWRLTLATPGLAPAPLPGQFLLVRCADPALCYLRRPVFPAFNPDETCSLLLRPDPDPGLAWLAARRPGDRLAVIGPLGTGFPLPVTARNLLLVSDGPALSPLLGQLERAVAAGLAVTLALGAPRASALYPLTALPPAVEVHAATLDGSLGQRGPVTDLLPGLLGWADLVCATGSAGLYRALRGGAEWVRVGARNGFLYGLDTTTPLACGVGACLACTVETEAGPRLACTEGPVFDLAEVVLG